MAKTSEGATQAIEALRPYMKRAMEDPELRDDLIAAFATARGLYDKIAKERGVKSKAAKVSDKDVQRDVQALIEELSEASGRLQGETKRKSHKLRNRVILLTGVAIGVLYNPWTGAATREWISDQIAGSSNGFEEFGEEPLTSETEASETAAPGNGGEPVSS